MVRAKSTTSSKDSSATVGFDAKFWLAADKLCNNMDIEADFGNEYADTFRRDLRVERC